MIQQLRIDREMILDFNMPRSSFVATTSRQQSLKRWPANSKHTLIRIQRSDLFLIRKWRQRLGRWWSLQRLKSIIRGISRRIHLDTGECVYRVILLSIVVPTCRPDRLFHSLCLFEWFTCSVIIKFVSRNGRPWWTNRSRRMQRRQPTNRHHSKDLFNLFFVTAII